MNSFNFKSQVCTSREQSERLLALGLKKETADCCYYYYDGEYLIAFAEDAKYPSDIPAWSLHRLIEMMPPDRKYEWLTISKNDVFYRYIHFGEEEFIGPDYCSDNLYDSFVIMYEWLIKEGYFPKEYLV